MLSLLGLNFAFQIVLLDAERKVALLLILSHDFTFVVPPFLAYGGIDVMANEDKFGFAKIREAMETMVEEKGVPLDTACGSMALYALTLLSDRAGSEYGWQLVKLVVEEMQKIEQNNEECTEEEDLTEIDPSLLDADKAIEYVAVSELLKGALTKMFKRGYHKHIPPVLADFCLQTSLAHAGEAGATAMLKRLQKGLEDFRLRKEPYDSLPSDFKGASLAG